MLSVPVPAWIVFVPLVNDTMVSLPLPPLITTLALTPVST
jgi:hypothetical protein